MNYTTGLVSIIIPCFNQGKYLTEALDSVITQTYSKWECIVVNDGSTDNSEEISKSYVVKDNRIKYIHQENQGVSKARNTGFLEAKGEFIQFLDGDDYLAPEKLSTQIEFFRDNSDFSVCYTGHYHYFQQNGMLKQYSIIDLTNDPLHNILFNWDRNIGLTIHNALFKRDLWADNELPFVGDFPYRYEDWVFWTIIAMKTNKFNYIKTPLVYYRIHDKGFTQSFELRLQSYVRAMFYIVNIIPKHYSDAFIEKNLKFAFEQYADLKIQKDIYQSFTWKIAKIIVRPILWVLPRKAIEKLKFKIR